MTGITEALQRALALPCFTAPEAARPLGGGKTNVNIWLKDQGRAYVVRLGHDIIEHGILRWHELAVSRAAHAAGVSPRVVHAEPGALVLDYIDAEPLTEADIRAPETMPALVDLLHRTHRQIPRHLRGPILSFHVFHILHDYAATLRETGSPHCAKLPALLAQAEHLASMIGPQPLVLGHNDLLPSNILRGEGRLWLIDWEYAGFTSPLFDLGGLASNAVMDRAGEIALLTGYFGTPPDADLLRRYDAMKCASLLRETFWSMVSEQTSALDFDYAAYTDMNLAAYHAAFAQLSL